MCKHQTLSGGKKEKAVQALGHNPLTIKQRKQYKPWGTLLRHCTQETIAELPQYCSGQ
ncbi:hypothetical protein COCSUDRAFT_31917 [Coccomyxa subellipsoidea C-169]|uniref:Uncharacterized protein n=1 Tax=Coccomyxa subellipsoidea (strain C-169) TaxID=574566 RepID=I0Z8V4_COCSC|nr:hypothetical protein COCSUDRAFT_31917 [Coccomyxa subellipsoidea C-169]EIE27073.1 hypothetical protein COCSUDRAFT_31917 [Coccomyxa subellipsoidea C-169]|eukprot:XP_005651617.1 hypothetical protein COCSUDRAFT_31917 [Coccomyxa subellipsoidea C-169]